MTEQKPYVIRFTPLAEAVANRHGGVAALEEQIREELLPPWGPRNIKSLFFHVVSFGGSVSDDDLPKFLCKPEHLSKDDVLIVDVSAGYVEEDEPLDKGAFKGKRISFVPEAFD
jgi:hypothetical protein